MSHIDQWNRFDPDVKKSVAKKGKDLHDRRKNADYDPGPNLFEPPAIDWPSETSKALNEADWILDQLEVLTKSWKKKLA
jgi:hypothetical protein